MKDNGLGNMQPDDDKTQAVTVLSKGTVISHYRIVEKIGAGGMGEVYITKNTTLNRPVTLEPPRHRMETVRANSGLSRKGWR